MKPPDQADACHDEYCPHRQGAHDSPEQDFMLMLRSNPEITENQQEDKKIVHAERKLDYVTGDEFHRSGVPMTE